MACKKIEALYAFVTEVPDDDGEEGDTKEMIMAAPMDDGGIAILVTDENGLGSMKLVAQEMADRTGRKLKILRFRKRVDSGTIERRLVSLH